MILEVSHGEILSYLVMILTLEYYKCLGVVDMSQNDKLTKVIYRCLGRTSCVPLHVDHVFFRFLSEDFNESDDGR